MLCCNFLKNTNVFNSVLIQLYGRGCLPGAVTQSMLQWAIALCRRVQLNGYSAPWLCGWWQVVRAQRLLSPHFPSPPLLPFWSFGEVSAELGGRNMPNCCQNQPPQYFQSLPLSFSFWGNLSCAGELWGKMIFRSHLLTGPLFGTKNKARFPETHSQGLFFSVLHCGLFFLDVACVGSLREGVALRTFASPYLDLHMIHPWQNLIACPYAWRIRWCTSPAHAEVASGPVTCLEISNCSGLLGKESYVETCSSRDELTFKHWFHGNSPWIHSVVSFKGWNTLQWLEHVELGCSFNFISVPSSCQAVRALQGVLWHSPILWDHCCGLRETLGIQTSN